MKLKPILDEQTTSLLGFYDSLTQNNDRFEQKIRITGLREVEGKERTDKDGKILVNEFGETLKWDTKYYVTYNCINSSGTHTATVAQSLFIELELNKNYIARGKIEYRIYGDSYNSTPVVVFDKFVSERDELLSSLAILKKTEITSKS
ncbi:hypothetical protein YY92_09070 [Campylobacter fetus]|nr:hypothetical protein [Campylobacter fetus]EAK0414860.1 hypothetical protein [Campylobacter fetus]TXF08795.1 hypothetical protein FPD25_03665 [Campylobacter fetus subsp. fetus]